MWVNNIYCKQFSLAYLSPIKAITTETLEAHSRTTQTQVFISAEAELGIETLRLTTVALVGAEEEASPPGRPNQASGYVR
jgi:hypothetical protein